MMTSLKQIEGEPEAGMFINSCFAHCQSELQDTWFALDSPMIHNKVIVIHKTKLPYAWNWKYNFLLAIDGILVNIIEFQKIAEVIGDWYFERGAAKEIDCAYPCDSTCHNLIPSDQVGLWGGKLCFAQNNTTV